jgi:hypothetical protein
MGAYALALSAVAPLPLFFSDDFFFLDVSGKNPNFPKFVSRATFPDLPALRPKWCRNPLVDMDQKVSKLYRIRTLAVIHTVILGVDRGQIDYLISCASGNIQLLIVLRG